MLKEGMNKINGEEFYFVPSPSLGLWTAKEKFIDSLNTNLAFAKRMEHREPDEMVWRELIRLDIENIKKYNI